MKLPEKYRPPWVETKAKSNLSTIDSVLIIAVQLRAATPETHIILASLTRSSDTVSRALLRAAILNTGLPITTIKRIRRARDYETHGQAGKQGVKYEESVENDVWGPRCSAVSAMLFIIYVDGVMGGYDTPNDQRRPRQHPTGHPSWKYGPR